MYTAKSAPFRIRFAFATWCLHTPPPSTIMPVLLGGRTFIARSLIRRISWTMSITRPGLRYVIKKSMSPIDPSVSAGQKICTKRDGNNLFLGVDHQQRWAHREAVASAGEKTAHNR